MSLGLVRLCPRRARDVVQALDQPLEAADSVVGRVLEDLDVKLLEGGIPCRTRGGARLRLPASGSRCMLDPRPGAELNTGARLRDRTGPAAGGLREVRRGAGDWEKPETRRGGAKSGNGVHLMRRSIIPHSPA